MIRAGLPMPSLPRHFTVGQERAELRTGGEAQVKVEKGRGGREGGRLGEGSIPLCRSCSQLVATFLQALQDQDAGVRSCQYRGSIYE